jgi:hypothetical protein
MGHLEDLLLAFTLPITCAWTFSLAFTSFTPSSSGFNSPRLLNPNIWCPRQGDEALHQTSAPPKTSQVTKGLEHIAFTDTQEVELQLAPNNNASTIAVGSSQNVRGTGSTQTNRGARCQSPPQAPWPSHDVQEHAKLEQLQVEDWEDTLSEDEVAEEAKLARVQQVVKRLQ